MTVKFLEQAQEVKTSIVPTSKEALARELIRMESAYTDVSALFPALDENHHAVLANVIKAIFNRAQNKGKGYTPFKSTPEGAITHPQRTVDWFAAQNAKMPPMPDNQSSRVTLNSISMLSGVSKGSLASVNAGQQHMTVHVLESWRKALAEIGTYNPELPEVHDYSALGDQKTFLYKLLEEWRDLVSTLPLSRIVEWASEYSGLTTEEIHAEVNEYSPTHREFMVSMVNVWREEYERGELDNFMDKTNLFDVLNTRTASRRIGRGFHTMIPAVHEGMASYNSRIKYPKTHLAEYKRRYSEPRVETGLTSEVLMGYCMFTGINPIAMLHWLAYHETKVPGKWVAKVANSIEDAIEWKGTVCPAEYNRFHAAIHRMGLVSDQNRWAMDLLSVSWVYHNLPHQDEVDAALTINAASMKTITETLPSYHDLASKLDYPNNLTSPIELALAAQVNVFNAHRDLKCLSLMSVGELTYHTLYSFDESKRDAEEEIRNNFNTAEEFTQYMQAHICLVCAHTSKPDSDNYMDVELDKGGKVVISKSYQTVKGNGRTMAATSNFYKALAKYLSDKS